MSLLEARILAVDPGSLLSGYACIYSKVETPIIPAHVDVVGMGVVRLPSTMSKNKRIQSLHHAYKELMAEFKPNILVIESAFYGTNVKTALVLGEARGAILASAGDIPVFELSPAEIKKTIAGNGRADKSQLASLLRSHFLLENGENLAHDATDALGAALSFALKHRQYMYDAKGAYF
jgi:crossover junction endodeoxyribonuclease RuvC